MESEYDKIPNVILLAINNHVLRGQRCGHFVTAVLSNDLTEAVNRADDECQKCLHTIDGGLEKKWWNRRQGNW